MNKKTWIILGAITVAAGIGVVIGKILYTKHKMELIEDEIYEEDESLFEE